MGLLITSLNSGSNGNCYYIGNDKDAVLIDAGISCREIEKRLKRLELDIGKIKAIFISHEHSDHIRGLKVLSKKYQLPVYITIKTLRNSKLFEENPLFVPFVSNEEITIGELIIKAFPKLHDAADPHSFTIAYQDKKVGVMTDIGEACDNVIAHFKQCHAVFLETNYDDEILDKGHYPYHLKKRIKSNIGHLSNHQALELFITHKPAFLSHLFFSHISKDNNNPDLILNLFAPHSNGTKVVVASREKEMDISIL